MRHDVKIWDPLVRIFHWAMVLSLATAWFSAHRYKPVHEAAGYVAATLISLRLIWGLVGSRHARFTDFVRGPGTVLRYLRDIARGQEQRFLGHNPAGGAMILALLACILVQVTTGWMMTTDMFFGVDWVETVHSLNFDLLVALVCFHLLGVVVASYRHRENLPLAMITGRKRVQQDTHGA